MFAWIFRNYKKNVLGYMTAFRSYFGMTASRQNSWKKSKIKIIEKIRFEFQNRIVFDFCSCKSLLKRVFNFLFRILFPIRFARDSFLGRGWKLDVEWPGQFTSVIVLNTNRHQISICIGSKQKNVTESTIKI